VAWFLIAATYFPKIKLTSNLSGLPENLPRIMEDTHLKAASEFFSLLSSLKANNPSSDYEFFGNFFLQKVG